MSLFLKTKTRLFKKLSRYAVYKKLQQSSVAHKIDTTLITCLKLFDSILNPYILWWDARKILPAITPNDVNQALNTLNKIKRDIMGRASGNVGDGLAQYLTVVQYIKQTGLKNIDTLEIGTLFGGSCLTKLFAIRNRECSGVAICIDPMKGYYGQEYDRSSNVPVKPEIFYMNIEKFNFTKKDIKLITEMSNSPNVHEVLKENSYATLFIDGDHSYNGVKHDWEHYNKYVAQGGFVIFHDYHENGWPDVTKFVDEITDSLTPEWKVCGVLGKTFILQRIMISTY